MSKVGPMIYEGE